VAEGE